MPALSPTFLHPLRALAATAVLAMRAAVRSRVVVALLILLAAGVVGIPRLVTGDGTPGSTLQVQLQYTLGYAAFVLGLATLWASCAAFGAEIDSRRFDLTATKPVHPLFLWLGHWTGILLLDAALLLAATVGVRLQLGLAPESAAVLSSRIVARPLLPDPRLEARETLERLRRENRLPPELPAAAVFRQLVLACEGRHTVLQPGEHASWRFRLERPIPSDGRLWLRVRFETGADMLSDVRGVFRMRRAGETAWRDLATVNELVRNELEIPVTNAALAGAADLELDFGYAAPPSAAAVLLQPRRTLAVLAPHGTFTGNLGRVWLSHLAVLAALAALGLTLGACFSFPVAAFVASAAWAVVLVTADNLQAGFVTDLELLVTHAGWIDRAARQVTLGVTSVMSPLLNTAPLAHAVAGERVPAAELRRVVLSGVLLYPAACAALGVFVLRRRELARQSAGN
jgi:hypothetical protein